MWENLRLATAPASAVVTTAEAKAHLRVEHSTDDTLIERLVSAATAMIDGPHGIGVAMVTQTWDLFLDYGLGCEIEIPLTPVASVTSITYTDTAGDSQTLATNQYRVIRRSTTRIVPAYGVAWPSTRYQLEAATVRFVAGYGAASAVPQDLREAVLLIVGHLYENREAVISPTGNDPKVIPLGVESILERYRVGRFA